MAGLGSGRGGAERASAARAAIGIVLLLLGVVLWLTLDAPWCGLISGVGVVVLYPIAGARIEEWRSRDQP